MYRFHRILGVLEKMAYHVTSFPGKTPRSSISAEADMKDDRSAFRAFEAAGESAARKRISKQSNPYLSPSSGESKHLLDEDSRRLLAAAWLRGWTRENAKSG
jgi:hypothetical protein